MKPLLIYVAGPYSGATRPEIEKNVNSAIDAGVETYLKGHFPYVPHLTDLVDRRAKETGNDLTWEDFIRWDMPWLKVCDAYCILHRLKELTWSLGRLRSSANKSFTRSMICHQ